jgi:hypothetical protein
MRDYEESPSRMENGLHELDDLDDLDDLTEADYDMMIGSPRMEVVIEIESSSLSL